VCTYVCVCMCVYVCVCVCMCVRVCIFVCAKEWERAKCTLSSANECSLSRMPRNMHTHTRTHYHTSKFTTQTNTHKKTLHFSLSFSLSLFLHHPRSVSRCLSHPTPSLLNALPFPPLTLPRILLRSLSPPLSLSWKTAEISAWRIKKYPGDFLQDKKSSIIHSKNPGKDFPQKKTDSRGTFFPVPRESVFLFDEL